MLYFLLEALQLVVVRLYESRQNKVNTKFLQYFAVFLAFDT